MAIELDGRRYRRSELACIAAEHFAEQLGIAVCKRILHIRRQVIELLGRFVEFVSGAVEFRLRIAKLFGNRAGRTRKRARRIIELEALDESSDVASVTELTRSSRCGFTSLLYWFLASCTCCFASAICALMSLRATSAPEMPYSNRPPWCRAGERGAPWSCSRHAECLPFE